MSLEAACEKVYEEKIRLKAEKRYRRTVFVASEDLFPISELHELALGFCSLISHLAL